MSVNQVLIFIFWKVEQNGTYVVEQMYVPTNI